jgi:hypothetical protein
VNNLSAKLVIPYKKLEISKLFSLLIVTIILGWVVATLPMPYQGLVPFLPVVLLIAVVSFDRPHLLVWLTLGLLFFGNRTEFPALYFWGRYLPTLGVVGFIGVIIARKLLLGKREGWQAKPLIHGYMLFVILLFVTAIYNGSGTREVVQGLATNLRYPLFFFALVNAGFAPNFYQRVIQSITMLTLLQVPVCILQAFAFGLEDDSLGGTMGSNQALVSVVLFCQGLLLARWLIIRKRRYLFAILVLFVPTLLADVQIGIIFFPFMTGFIFFQYYGFRQLVNLVQHIFPFFLFSVVVVLGSVIFIPTVKEFSKVVSQYYLRADYYTRAEYARVGSIGRLTILRFSVPLLLEDPLHLIWGFGPEAAQGGLVGGTYNTAFSVQYGNMGVVCRKLIEQSLLCREPQSFKSLMEYGVMGTLLYFIPLVSLWRRSSRLLQPSRSVEDRVLWLFFQGAGFFYIFLAFWYIGVWRVDSYSFIFWLVAAAVHAESRKLATLGGESLYSSEGAIIA